MSSSWFDDWLAKRCRAMRGKPVPGVPRPFCTRPKWHLGDHVCAVDPTNPAWNLNCKSSIEARWPR